MNASMSSGMISLTGDTSVMSTICPGTKGSVLTHSSLPAFTAGKLIGVRSLGLNTTTGAPSE